MIRLLEVEHEQLSLEEQFESPEVFKLDDQDLTVVDVKPEYTRSEVPVLLAPGNAVGPKTWKKAILALAEGSVDQKSGVKRGRRVLSVDAYHGIDTQPHPVYPEAEMRKVAAIVAAIEEKGVDQVDAVAHSEGALYVSLAAKLHPEKFRNLVLMNPAGMIGHDSLGRLMAGALKDTVRQNFRSIFSRNFNETLAKFALDSSRSTLSSPKKEVKEVFAITQTQIHDILRDLKTRGIGVAVIHSVDDDIFPMERIQQKIAPVKDIDLPSQSGKYKEMVDGFYSFRGTHNQAFVEPEKIMHLADHALEGLEHKSQDN